MTSSLCWRHGVLKILMLKLSLAPSFRAYPLAFAYPLALASTTSILVSFAFGRDSEYDGVCTMLRSGTEVVPASCCW